MSADDTNNNNNLSSVLTENTEDDNNLQSNNSMIIVDENIVISDNNNNNINNDETLNNNNNNIINDDDGKIVEDNNLVDALFMEESINEENKEPKLENIIMENEIINNIKYNNNPITEFNCNLVDNIKSIVDLFGNRPDTLILELNRFIQNFFQKNIEEIQFLRVKNHVLEELIEKSKLSESSSREAKEDSVILELTKMRREKSNIQISPPSPETNEFMQSGSANSLIGVSTNNPLRRTRRIRKKQNEPIHKVSSSDDEEDQKMDDRNSEVYRRLSSVRLSEYPSSDINHLESDDDEETDIDYSTPEKPKKKKKKNTSEEDDDYIPKQNPKIQSRTNIIHSNHPPKSTMTSPPSSSSIASSSLASRANNTSSVNSNVAKPPMNITNPITIINNSGPPTQPTTTAAPKRRGRPRRVRPEEAINTQPSISGPLGTVMTQPLIQEATKNPLSTAASIQRISSTTEEITAPNSLSSSNTVGIGPFPSVTPSEIRQINNKTSSTVADTSQSIAPTSEISLNNSQIPPPNNMLEGSSQANPSSNDTSSSLNFSNVNSQMMSQQLLAQQKKRGPKPGPRRGGSKAMFTIYDSNSFKLTYEKPGVTKITKASISNGPQTIFVDSDMTQYAELSSALNSIGSNGIPQYGNASESQSRPNSTNENASSSSSNAKSTSSITTTTQPNNINNANSSISTAASSTTATDTGITSHNNNNNSSSKASRRFNSHASNTMITNSVPNNQHISASGSPTSSTYDGQHKLPSTGASILVMNPTSNIATPPILVPSINPKRSIDPINSGRDYYAQIPTETNEASLIQDNKSADSSSIIIKHEEKDEDTEITSRQTDISSISNTGALQNDPQTLPPPIVRIRLAPSIIASSSNTTNFNTTTESTSTIEEKKKLFGRRVRKV